MRRFPSGAPIASGCISRRAGMCTWAADSDRAATFGYVAEEAAKRKIAFICARETPDEPRLSPMLKKVFGGTFIANQKLTKATGEALLAKGEADAVAFGQLFIANPDLPLRFAKNASLNMPDPETFYATGPDGYTDYPFLDQR